METFIIKKFIKENYEKINLDNFHFSKSTSKKINT